MAWEDVLHGIGGVPPWAMALLVLLVGLAEAIPFLGLLVPAHTLLFLASAEWGFINRDPSLLILACVLGGFLGDTSFFVLGRRRGLAFAEGWPKWARLTPERRVAIEALFAKKGFLTVVLARTQPFIRSFVPYAAGAMRQRATRFIPAALLGNIAATVAVVLGGWLFGHGSKVLGKVVGGAVIGVALAVVVALVLSYVLTRRLRWLSAASVRHALGALACGAGFVWILRDALDVNRLHALEAVRLSMSVHAFPSWIGMVGGVVGTLASPALLLAASFALFVGCAWRRRWPAAFGALAIGPGLVALLAILSATLHRAPPQGVPPFPFVGSFPHAASALAMALAAWSAWSLRARGSSAAAALRSAAFVGLAILVGALAVASSAAWPTDVLAGLLLGAAWASLVALGETLALHLLDPALPDTPGLRPVHALRRLGDRFAAWCDRSERLQVPLLLGLIGLGVAVRLVAPWLWPLGPDADRYAAMAKGLLDTGSFTMPWGDVYSAGMGPQPSHHYPPLYPTVLAGVYSLLGFSRDATRVASIALALAAIAVTYLCSRDLYGHRKGLVAAAVVAVSPVLVLTTDKGYAENLLLLLFVATMWAILKSLEKPWFIVVGALFAALGYLTKSSVGTFFLVAGAGGLAWRLRFRGLKVLRDPAYLTAIALFGSVVVAWAWRNWSLFGSWQTSAHIQAAYDNALAHPLEWAGMLAFSSAVMFGLGYLLFMAVAPWLAQLRRVPLLADEHDSGLWLAAVLPLVLTVLIDAALWLFERDFFLHNVRYVSFALVPLAWLVMRHVRPGKAAWLAVAASALVLVAGTLYYAVPQEKVENRVSTAWGQLASAGDSVSLVGTNDVYRYYFDLTDSGHRSITDVRVLGLGDLGNVTTTWVLVHGDPSGLPSGYAKVLEEQGPGTSRLVDAYSLWRQV